MFHAKGKIENVKGTNDILPVEYERRKYVIDIINDVFESFGYRGVQVPILEDIDLHLRKSGELIRKNLYSFKDQGNETICLRPELTASVVRMFNKQLTKERLPLKLHYMGSAFRYDKPQKGRYREFTQTGIEIIGASDPYYDAEVIAIACKTMQALGIKDYDVVIGNIGIILELLAQKGIDERTKNYIIEKLEDLSKSDEKLIGFQEIEEGLKKIGIPINNESSHGKKELVEAVQQLPKIQAEKVIAWVIETIYGNTGAGRDSSEIARNLLLKITRDEQMATVRESLDFIRDLVEIDGYRETVFNDIDVLVNSYNLNSKPIDELKEICDYLNYFDVDWSKIKIDFGFGRGLAYYTGMIFEIYCHNENLGGSQKQVCGGGRYDSLVRDLGGTVEIPALGFSFGLDRIILSMPDSTQTAHLDALVAPLGGKEEFKYALKIANHLRREGIKTEIGPRGKSTKAFAKMAGKMRVDFALFIGEDELSKGIVSLRDMRQSSQTEMSIDDLITVIKKGAKNR